MGGANSQLKPSTDWFIFLIRLYPHIHALRTSKHSNSARCLFSYELAMFLKYFQCILKYNNKIIIAVVHKLIYNKYFLGHI